MIHLTFTGYYSGRPLCGCDRFEGNEAGDTFMHAMYAPLHNPNVKKDVCPKCLEIWESEDD